MMKKLQSHNIVFIILYVVQIVVTGFVMLTVLLFKPIDEMYVIIFGIISAVGYIVVILAPYIAFLHHKLWLEAVYDLYNPHDKDGQIIVATVKFIGYVLLCAQLVLLFM